MENSLSDDKTLTLPVHSKKRTIIFVSCLSVTAIALGIGAGFYLHNMLNSGVSTDYGNADANDYVENDPNLLKDYEAVKASGGDYVAAYAKKPYKVANIAYTLYSQHEHTFAQGVGAGTAILGAINVDQQIRSTIIKNGTSYFEESLSASSVVQLADRMYQETSVKAYHGKVDSSDVETPKDFGEAVEYTQSEYKDLMGKTLDMPCIYIISGKTTYVNSTTYSGTPTSFTKKDDGTYDLQLELTRSSSVLNYVKQMQSISNLYDKPSFSYVHLSFSLDKDLNLLTMTSNEFYFARTAKNVGSNVKGYLKTIFKTDEEYGIPKLNTPVKYWDAQ
jgi:hypothetical protein